MGSTAKITVRRRDHYMGLLRSFKIYVDDKMLATVGNGKAVDFEVEPGLHRIDVLGALWAKSQELSFEAQSGANLTFECGIQGKYLYPFLVMVIISFFAKGFLYTLPGGRILALCITLAIFVYSIVLTAMTFRRGVVYYVKQVESGRD